MAAVISTNISARRGTRKSPVRSVTFIPGVGVRGDGHSGHAVRQVSLLAIESIDKMRAKGLKVGPGDFAENITTRGMDLPGLGIGTELALGRAVLEVSQIGKVCHDRCEIYRQAGDCVMPREGIFGVVLKGGTVRKGDRVRVLREAKYRAGILTASDRCSRGETVDGSGKEIEMILKKIGAKAVKYRVVPDEVRVIEKTLVEWSDGAGLDLVLTTGGTGLAPRDVTPDATLKVIEKEVPGVAEAMRMKSLEKTPHAMISRAVAGVRKRTLIINLPGSVRAVRENLAVILPALPHMLDKLKGDPADCGRPQRKQKRRDSRRASS